MHAFFATLSFLSLIFATHAGENEDGVNRQALRQQIQKYFSQTLLKNTDAPAANAGTGHHGHFRRGSNQGTYFLMALTPTIQAPNGELAVVQDGEDLWRMETGFTNRFFESAEVAIGQRKNNLRFQVGANWVRLNNNPDNVTYLHPFLFPLAFDPVEQFSDGNTNNLGIRGGIFVDLLDRSQGDYDEIYYVGTSVGLVRSAFHSNSEIMPGSDASMVTTHELEVGALYGLTASTNLQIAFQVLRVGNMLWSESGQGVSFDAGVGREASFRPYTRYMVKIGLMHFFARH